MSNMNYSDQTSFMPMQSLYSGASDAVNCWPPFAMNNEDQHSQFEQHAPPFKRPRNSEEPQSNPMPYPPLNNSRVHPSNAPVNRGINNIFYKTRLCANFKNGSCRNGEHCNYAHGIDDIRQPPPNWQELVSVREEDRPLTGNWEDDQKIIQRMKLCKKFNNGEECPYGDRCNFLHEEPAKFREDSGRYRENTAISIGTTGAPSSTSLEDNRPNTGVDVFRGNLKPYWKTKICNKWEQTGNCPFGEKCDFAHGQAELQLSGMRVEAEVMMSAPIATKPQAVPINDSSTVVMPAMPAAVNEEAEGKKCGLKWRNFKKINQINRIYGDWLDDVPLLES
ncbi:zinc finger CCCH domain-containing protein 39-like [Argentina anserina]|uniref:zinc finger CCCH domain-containing protein 39-like n=1 Tax=Argentina anserina TaxID=57926 RepID=UPI0021764043|nr:zinc finger CCCH domain-containing protein 39-like [Potentilla anserina]XP_050373964.1 zinc finger CCCH domain-containing protein 39-like [Potentilla anserina]